MAYISDYELFNRGARKTKSEQVLIDAHKTKVAHRQEIQEKQIEEIFQLAEQKDKDWQQKAEVLDKHQYLARKLPHLECQCQGKCVNAMMICSHCWWNNITIPYSDIPVCKNCQTDSLKYQEIFLSNYENPHEEYRKYEKCSRWCLWHDYFFDQLDF